MREAAGNILSRIDPAETRRIQPLTNALFPDVFSYTAPSDLKGDKVIDIRPQTSRSLTDQFSNSYSREFDLRKQMESGLLSVTHDDAAKRLNISKELSPAPSVLHTMDEIADNGTWAVGNDATNLTKDSLFKTQGNASLNFDLDGSTTDGYIENSTMTAVDLTTQDELGTLFVNVYLPDASVITNVTLRWGNDVSNYWSGTATTRHDGTALQNGWNLVCFDWNGATETGSVNPAAIDYLRVGITYDGNAETDIRVDYITAAIGAIYDIEYYSKFLFRSSAGVWLEEPTATDDTDIVNLDTEAYNIFLYELSRLIALELQGEDSTVDTTAYSGELNGDGTKPGLYKEYTRSNPSQALKKRQFYYRKK
jgi:hypothetical protein